VSYEIETADLSLGDLFGGQYNFVLPEFQREFSWETEQAEDLLEDIFSVMADRDRGQDIAPYFLGTMLFALPGEDDPLRQTQIVDGQQRITTLTILLAVLRDLETDPDRKALLHRHIAVWSTKGDDTADAFHLLPRRADRAFLARNIQKDGATTRRRRRSLLHPESPAQLRMDAVRGHFKKRLRGDLSDQERTEFADFLVNGCRVLVMRTASLDYAYNIFLTLNSRGLPLTTDDIVVAEVIGPLDSQQRARFAPIVEQMARYREPDEQGRSRGKTFFSHLVAQQGWSSQSMIRELRRAVAAQGGARNFTRNVFQPMAEAYLLTRCDFANSRPPVPVAEALYRLALLEQLCDDEWVGLAMHGLSRMALDDPNLPGFLNALDRFAHAQLALRPTRSERRKRYRRAIVAIKKNAPADEALALSEAEQQRVLRRVALQLDGTTSRTGKAFLARLDAALSQRSAKWYLDTVADSAVGGDGLSVEHVLPKGQSLPRQSGWRKAFPSHTERRKIADCLGNLMLVNEKLNRRVAQQDWTDKKAAFAADPLTSRLALFSEFADLAQWDHATIMARQDRLLGLVAEIWSLSGDRIGVPGQDERPTASPGDVDKPPPTSRRKGRRRARLAKQPQPDGK